MAAAMLAAPQAAARTDTPQSSALTYIEARAAAMRGEHGRSAELLAGLAERSAGDLTISRKALGEAIGAGDMALALRLAHRLKPNELTTDARLLLIAEELRRRQPDRAMPFVTGANDDANLQFLEPLIRAWAAVERRDLASALTVIDQIPVNSLLGPYRYENRAFILLKFRRTAEAEPFARQAIAASGGRENRLRLALADGFLAAGDRARAAAMVEGMGSDAGPARQRIAAGKRIGLAIDDSARAYAELLLGLAVDLNRLNNRALPVSMVQVARYADPRNSAGSVLLALLLESQGRTDQALLILGAVAASDPLAPQALDASARMLIDQKKFDEALALARLSTTARDATVGDFSRLGDVLQSSKRYNEAADAYGRAIGLT
ncbi:MAG: hypothetical protein ABIT68_06905, partial [Sphingomicrobium sp.]